MIKPVFTRPIDELNKKVEAQVASEVDKRLEEKVKIEVEARVSAILKEKEEKEKSDKSKKIAEAVDAAKQIKGNLDKDKDKSGIGSVGGIGSIGDGVLCPTCHAGHVHKVEADKTGMVFKCVGDKCGKEYVMLPTDADYKCVNCGIPIKRPEDPEVVKSMSCPFCKSPKAVKFDWDKLRKVVGTSASSAGSGTGNGVGK